MSAPAGAAGGHVRVVVFSGGRGSAVLSERLVADPRVELTLAINGFDDGRSTGALRRFLGDCLGPSDFRKNAARLARALGSASAALVDLLEERLPEHADAAAAAAALAAARGRGAAAGDPFLARLGALAAALAPAERAGVGESLDRFEAELARRGADFRFGDCCLGNLVFAGRFLAAGRRFDRALDDYCALLGLAAGTVDNVTDGGNAWLVAIDRDGRLLASEAEIVAADRAIDDIFLVERPIGAAERERLAGASRAELAALLAGRAARPAANPRLLARLAAADLVVYAPGTQHSSLFPSYLVPGIAEAIAGNLGAIKLLVTNLEADADIPTLSAVELRHRALHFLRRRGELAVAAPRLVTHCLLNDPASPDERRPYLPLGRLRSVEDPRLLRIADFEEEASGRHDAERVLTPFVESFLARSAERRIGVVLLSTESLDKVSQTLLEALRAGLGEVPARFTVLYRSAQTLAADFAAALPFACENLARDDAGPAGETELVREAAGRGFDDVILFESSGRYLGEEIVNVAALLVGGSLDAVWGSRRLSLRDIRESYRLRYRGHRLIGAVSYVGSHLLSLACLALHGRYVSDTLTGVRAVRAGHLTPEVVAGDPRLLNQRLLSAVLGARGELFETPVRFFAMSPDQVERPTVGVGLAALVGMLRWRLARRRRESGAAGARERVGGSAGAARRAPARSARS